jgi:membrane-associated protease RseP (regulator of RpoE activity)
MNSYNFDENGGISRGTGPEPELILAELVPQPQIPTQPLARRRPRRVWLPLGLFLATCISTLLAGGLLDAVYVGYLQWRAAGPLQGLVDAAITAVGYCSYYALGHGWKYALPVMTILICHEAGHFVQARRYRVHASYPYFIPMPITPLGTLGAVIVMEPRMGHRRALFDIGITGPLAGLVPTLLFCVWGLYLSEVKAYVPRADQMMLGEPLLFKVLGGWIHGPIPEGHDLYLHPVAFAGWVGLLITALNLLPIGQLDGGHILYGLLRTKAHKVATLLLLAAVGAVIWYRLWGWTLMLMLLMLMGPVHPPTANDQVPLGPVRTVLGWLALAFIPIGFTPTPFLLGF